MTKYVYLFNEGNKDQKDLLGGKGANLAEMTNLGLPVPPGFTISTDACRAYLDDGASPQQLDVQVTKALRQVEQQPNQWSGTLGQPGTAGADRQRQRGIGYRGAADRGVGTGHLLAQHALAELSGERQGRSRGRHGQRSALMSCARERTPKVSSRVDTWFFTVPSDRHRRSAICRLDSPASKPSSRFA